MCGIAGFWSFCKERPSEPEAVLRAMASRIAHRGPDAEGVLWLPGAGVGLAHRRLAIQDLSAAGAQPMESASGRFAVVFNGEIYNFRALGRELAQHGYRFRGHSDTEILLAAIEAYGVEPALARLAGMFAFALWDREHRALWLARDRMGEKPLYYGWQGNTLLFASELKALDAYPGFAPAVDRDALCLLLRHNYIPAPHSIFQGIHKLPPAQVIRFDANAPAEPAAPRAYWTLTEAFAATPEVDEAEAASALERLLGDVIEEQMVADVPLGAFLSGGVDSSTVVALMQQRAAQPVRTFSIGFDEAGFNEAEHAAAVARHLGTSHTELYASPEDALALVPRLPQLYDEPFADASQLPTHLVSRLTREHVTVALSGDGGDELFAGYPRYPDTLTAWQRVHEAPGGRQRLERALLNLPDAMAGPAARLASASQRPLSGAGLREKLAHERRLRALPALEDFYRQRIGYWADPAALVRGGAEPAYALSGPLPAAVRALPPVKQLMWLDLNSYLPDDILTKVDRAAMAVSLETRIPLLDHRVVRFALGLPGHWNLRGRTGKQVLRQVLYRHVPRELVDRPKQGFAVPLGQWLRGQLRDWAESLLDERRLRESGYWHTNEIRRVWADHLHGRADYSFQLWGVLMFEAWREARQQA